MRQSSSAVPSGGNPPDGCTAAPRKRRRRARFPGSEIDFAVAEFAERRLPRACAEVPADFFRQRRVGAPAEDLELIVDQRFAFRRRLVHARRGGILPVKGSCRRKPGLSGTPVQLGAPALGYGRLRTPPNRYPPARLPALLAGATPA